MKFPKFNIQNLTTLLIVTFSYAIVFVLFFVKIPVENVRLIDTSLGFLLGGALGSVTGFLFTSSVKNKNSENSE